MAKRKTDETKRRWAKEQVVAEYNAVVAEAKRVALADFEFTIDLARTLAISKFHKLTAGK
jgi:hypothetical protein